MTELVNQNSGSLAVVNMREDSRKGAEEIKQEDVSTPILKISRPLRRLASKRGTSLYLRKTTGRAIFKMAAWAR